MTTDGSPLSHLVDLLAQRGDLDTQIGASLTACRAAGVTVATLMQTTGWSRQTVYTRLKETAPARLVSIETSGTQTKVDRIVTETLGRHVRASRTGRLGFEVTLAASESAAVMEALKSAGLDTYITYR